MPKKIIRDTDVRPLPGARQTCGALHGACAGSPAFASTPLRGRL